MSSPCLSGGGGRAYGFDLEIVKSTSSRTSQTTSSSPSSTLSESSNSPLAISTRKPRTPRKRPNQTYNEAAALLSTAYPKIFPAAAVPTSKPFSPLPLDSSELLFFPIREKSKDPKSAAAVAATEVSSRDNSCQSSSVDWKELCGGGGGYEEDDFDAESMLDEEIEQGGIDSIMGNLSVVSSEGESAVVNQGGQIPGFVYGYPPGFSSRNFHQWGVGNGGGNRGVIRAFRRVDDWWSYPVVDVLQISPRLNSTNRRPSSSFNGESDVKAAVKQSVPSSGEKKKKSSSSSKKKKKVEKLEENESKAVILGEEEGEENRKGGKSGGLLLKLNYDEVLKAWSGKGSPFPEDGGGGLLDGNDVSITAAQIDLFSSDGGANGGVREASVLRYKEKRLSRLFSKKIRYQVRKVNADQRPRMKGRFVRRPGCSRSGRSSGSPSSSSQNDDEL